MTKGRMRVDFARVNAARAELRAMAVEHPEDFTTRTAKEWGAFLERTEAMKDESSIQIGVRLPKSIVARVDAMVEQRKQADPGVSITRSDIVRQDRARSRRRRDGQVAPARRGPLQERAGQAREQARRTVQGQAGATAQLGGEGPNPQGRGSADAAPRDGGCVSSPPHQR